MLYFAKVGYAEGTWIEEKIFPHEEWLRDAWGGGICPQCKCINRTGYPQPLNPIVENSTTEQTSAWLENTFITLWHRGFIPIRIGGEWKLWSKKLGVIENENTKHKTLITCACLRNVHKE